ncbi:MAG: hypothetical protein HY286_14470 [Planctomycetes bacterium]|nr:hypothetical protein [Planctomycetota bacterium]
MEPLPFEAANYVDSFVGALAGICSARAIALGASAISGETGRAFRHCSPLERAHDDGWREEVNLSLRILGFESGEFCDGAAAVDLLNKSAVGNHPFLLWHALGSAEFGISRGVDRDRLFVNGRTADGMASGILTFDAISRDPNFSLVALGPFRAPAEQLQQKVARALRELRGGGAGFGLAAFDAWQQILAGENIDAGACLRSLNLLSESRMLAAAWLTDQADAIPEGTPGDADAVELALAANELDSSQQLISGVVRELFTLADDLNRHERRAAAAGMLATAKRREEASAAHLEAVVVR